MCCLLLVLWRPDEGPTATLSLSIYSISPSSCGCCSRRSDRSACGHSSASFFAPCLRHLTPSPLYRSSRPLRCPATDKKAEETCILVGWGDFDKLLHGESSKLPNFSRDFQAIASDFDDLSGFYESQTQSDPYKWKECISHSSPLIWCSVNLPFHCS